MLKNLLTSILFTFLLVASIAYAQPPAGGTYAAAQTNGGTNDYKIEGATNARNAADNIKPNDSNTKITANPSLAGMASAWTQLDFGGNLAAGTTVYIRTSDITSLVAANKIAVTASAADGSAVALSNGIKTVYLADGSTLISVIPGAAFSSVRLTIQSGLASYSLQIYYALYYPFNPKDCGKPVFTSKEIELPTVTVAVVDVLTPGAAIDALPTSKSSFSITGLMVGEGHMRQFFNFSGPSNPGDAVKITLSKAGSLVNLDVAKGITLRAYNGSTLTGVAEVMTTLLDAALLDLLSTGEIAFYYTPRNASGQYEAFDRVELDVNIKLLNLSVLGTLVSIHDVQRVPAAPNSTPVTTCANIGTALLKALSPQSSVSNIGSFSYAWYNSIRGTSALSGNGDYNLTGLNQQGTYDYYVETRKSASGASCIASPRQKVTVTVQPAPVIPGLDLNP